MKLRTAATLIAFLGLFSAVTALPSHPFDVSEMRGWTDVASPSDIRQEASLTPRASAAAQPDSRHDMYQYFCIYHPTACRLLCQKKDDSRRRRPGDNPRDAKSDEPDESDKHLGNVPPPGHLTQSDTSAVQRDVAIAEVSAIKCPRCSHCRALGIDCERLCKKKDGSERICYRQKPRDPESSEPEEPDGEDWRPANSINVSDGSVPLAEA
ncbi:hypothetical protein K490DRAFT_59524 [Saccharata proteae CBS 121410]|uniref:Zn(2)-C6 fungal-type domain-containing protein n=1 Tax=Saccharata proteae CBS 121410 TaxID=1314787 RepID=A0A9P4HQ02_9PEZI|nr:hypothetical protein K490DRAFT_59524 [Saccharata proteae CBS 121410]